MGRRCFTGESTTYLLENTLKPLRRDLHCRYSRHFSFKCPWCAVAEGSARLSQQKAWESPEESNWTRLSWTPSISKDCFESLHCPRWGFHGNGLETSASLLILHFMTCSKRKTSEGSSYRVNRLKMYILWTSREGQSTGVWRLRKGLTVVGQTPLFLGIVSFRPLEPLPQVRFPPFNNHAPLFLWLISASLIAVNNFQRYLKWRHSQKKMEIIKCLLSACLHCTSWASYSVGKPLTAPEHVNHKASPRIKFISLERAPNV